MRLLEFYTLESLDFPKLMEVYRESNEDNVSYFYPEETNLDKGRHLVEQKFHDYLRADFYNKPGNRYYSLEDNGAWLSAIRLFSVEGKDNTYFAEALETAPTHRRKGYARKMMELLFDHLGSEGSFEITDTVNKSNEASLQFHLSCGFEIYKDPACCVLNGNVDENAYTMRYVGKGKRNIERVDSYEDSRFSQRVLNQHGAYLIDGEPYEVEIVDTITAVVRVKDTSAYPDLIEEFRFNAPQITRFLDADNKLISELTPEQMVTIKLEDIQPSQFFIDRTKLEAVKTFIHEPDDIVIQAKPWNNRYISLDGHTRLYLAVERGYETVKAVISESDEWVWPFVDEAVKRGITIPKDMQLLPHDQYEIQWNQYCDSVFDNNKS
ncbi:MAG: GNAT family N-acetyltransferase [Butyrivibrio sp.]|nr:GNAT family N-acetyltransferase [Butyrivibrio sp.]